MMASGYWWISCWRPGHSQKLRWATRCVYVQFASYFVLFLQTSVYSVFMQIKTRTDLNDSNISTSIVPIKSESYGLQIKHSTLTNMDHCQTVNFIRVNDPGCHEVNILQSYLLGGLGSGRPKSSIFFFANIQGLLVTFLTSTEADIDICPTQVCMLCNFW